MAIRDARHGEFTLVYHGEKAKPVVLTNEQHELLQIYVVALGCTMIVEDMDVEYMQRP